MHKFDRVIYLPVLGVFFKTGQVSECGWSHARQISPSASFFTIKPDVK